MTSDQQARVEEAIKAGIEAVTSFAGEALTPYLRSVAGTSARAAIAAWLKNNA